MLVFIACLSLLQNTQQGRAPCSTVKNIDNFCGKDKAFLVANSDSLCAGTQCTKEKDRDVCCAGFCEWWCDSSKQQHQSWESRCTKLKRCSKCPQCPRAKCSSVAHVAGFCGEAYVYNSLRNSSNCSSTPCHTATDRDQCCAAKAPCTTALTIPGFCGSNKRIDPNSSKLCSGETCKTESDASTCCDVSIAPKEQSGGEKTFQTTITTTTRTNIISQTNISSPITTVEGKADDSGTYDDTFFGILARGGTVVTVFIVILLILGAGVGAIVIMSVFLCRKKCSCARKKSPPVIPTETKSDNVAKEADAHDEPAPSRDNAPKAYVTNQHVQSQPQSDLNSLKVQLQNMEKELMSMLPVGVPTWMSMKQLLSRPNRLRTFKKHCMLARSLIHSSVITLIDDYIALKRRFGTSTEKKLYQTMTHEDMITRMLRCRMLTFVNHKDNYTRRDGRTGTGLFVMGSSYHALPSHADDDEEQEEKYKDAQSMPDYADEMSNYEDALQTGTSDHVSSPLTLPEYMCYDEVEIAALMSFGGPTLFLNEGHRDNKGYLSQDCCPTGLYVGCVGARLEKAGRMERRFMLVTKRQNTEENGYGPNGSGVNKYYLQIWAKFYNVRYFPLYDEIQAGSRFLQLGNGDFLDRHIFRKRIRYAVLPFLCYADQQAALKQIKAYVHVVPLGLGKWSVHECQAIDQLDAYGDLLQKLELENVSDVHFSGFPSSCVHCRGAHDGELLAGVRIHFSNRNPAATLQGDDASKLLVAQYSWDGNSFPGNEYWGGWMATSSNTAAACCSTIALSHNPIYNKVNIHAGNTAIYSSQIYNNMRTRPGHRSLDSNKYLSGASSIVIGSNSSEVLDVVM